jgi:tetratricopeptide (TPR) repeat protein
MALEMAPAVIDLREVATGRIVAKLEDPHGDRAGWMGFTPDGTQLVVAAHYAKAIHVWDLRAIRQRLKLMGLDWDWPEFKPADATAKSVEPPTIEVLPGDLANPILRREQQARQNIERYGLAIKANPDDAKACNDLAWVYLTAPEALRDVKAALPLAEKAVRLSPGNAVYGNTLGVAYYRAGKYREAIKILRTDLNKQEDWALAFDLYFLAMSHHRLGDSGRARDYYDWAVRWERTQPGLSAGHLEELTVIQAEAEELLTQESGAKSQESEKKQKPD